MYFVTPKQVVAKAYIKTLLNKHGFYWRKLPSQLLDDLGYAAVSYAKAVSSLSRKMHFSTELESICKIYTYQLCDKLEGNNSEKDVSDDVKHIFSKYDFSSFDSKAK